MENYKKQKWATYMTENNTIAINALQKTILFVFYKNPNKKLSRREIVAKCKKILSKKIFHNDLEKWEIAIKSSNFMRTIDPLLQSGFLRKQGTKFTTKYTVINNALLKTYFTFQKSMKKARGNRYELKKSR